MIGFVGLTHLGIVSSVVTASKGFQVMGFDTDKALVQAMSQGKLESSEKGLQELLVQNRSRLKFTSDLLGLSQCNMIVFSLDVPTDSQNHSDLMPLRTLVESVEACVSQDTVLVIMSQVPPGFTRREAQRIRLEGGSALPVIYQAETLILGSAVERALHPERSPHGRASLASRLPSHEGSIARRRNGMNISSAQPLSAPPSKWSSPPPPKGLGPSRRALA